MSDFSSEVMQLLRELLKKIDKIDEKVSGTNETLTEHILEEEKTINEIRKSVPDGDFRKHHDWHKQKNESEERIKNRVSDILTEVIKKAAWGILFGIAYILWEYLKRGS